MRAEGQAEESPPVSMAGQELRGCSGLGNPLCSRPGSAMGCLCCFCPKTLVLIPNWEHLKGKGTLGDALGWV